MPCFASQAVRAAALAFSTCRAKQMWVDLERGKSVCVCERERGGGGDLQQNRASDSSSCERMRSACLKFVPQTW